MPLLLPTHNFGKQEPSALELGVELSSWALVGVLVNGFAQGLQKKPIFSRPLVHAAWAVAFGGLGYLAHKLERYETGRLLVERDRLVKRRLMRLNKEQEAADH